MPALLVSFLLTTASARATGLPPTPTILVRDSACAATTNPTGPLRITYDLMTGSCAPGGPCSSWAQAALDASSLVVKLDGCDTPLLGQFAPVAGDSCEDRPLWQWTGTLLPGRTLLIGDDGGAMRGWLQVPGVAVDPAGCPPESPITPLPASAVQRTGPLQIQPYRFAEDTFSLEDGPTGTHILWRPVGMLSWEVAGFGGGLRSVPVSRTVAEAALAAVPRGPGGLEIQWQIRESRYHYEGYIKRGIRYCEVITEQDADLTLVGADLVLQGTAQRREAVDPSLCMPTP